VARFIFSNTNKKIHSASAPVIGLGSFGTNPKKQLFCMMVFTTRDEFKVLNGSKE
jgi:hypothetical protein